MDSTTRNDFHVRHLLDFYRTTAELWLSINRSEPFKFRAFLLTYSKRLDEATVKLEKLKALQYYDVDTELITLMGEIDVNVLQGNAEEVTPPF